MNTIKLSKPGAEEGELQMILEEPKFILWWNKVKDLDVRSIDIRDADWFAAKPKVGALGFLKVNCTIMHNGTLMSQIAFIRGESVAILIRVLVDGAAYYLMTVQLRFPIGDPECIECPAGMLDASDNFIGVAAKEIKEETGILINKDDLVDLGYIYPSPGGCDEKIGLFLYEVSISSGEFDRMGVAVYGTTTENESIKLLFVPERKFSSALVGFGDVKTEVAYRRYLARKRNRILM